MANLKIICCDCRTAADIDSSMFHDRFEVTRIHCPDCGKDLKGEEANRMALDEVVYLERRQLMQKRQSLWAVWRFSTNQESLRIADRSPSGNRIRSLPGDLACIPSASFQPKRYHDPIWAGALNGESGAPERNPASTCAVRGKVCRAGSPPPLAVRAVTQVDDSAPPARGQPMWTAQSSTTARRASSRSLRKYAPSVPWTM